MKEAGHKNNYETDIVCSKLARLNYLSTRIKMKNNFKKKKYR